MNLPCPHCGSTIEVPPELFGQLGICPFCGQEMHFPVPDDVIEEAERRRLKNVQEKVISGVLAVVAHMLLLGVLVYLIADKPRGVEAGNEVAFADLPGVKLTQSEEGTLESVPLSEAPAVESLTAPSEIAPPSSSMDSTALSLPEIVPSGGPSGAGGQGLDLRPPGAAAGGKGKLKFMGVEGEGSRFLIIADRSGSMTGPKLEYLKAEILKTLSDLGPGTKFYVIFYNDLAEPMPGNRWVSGRSQAAQAAAWVKSVNAFGQTDPLPAFQIAFQMKPRPDTIFFMTDGLFSGGVPAQVAALNTGRPKVTIHTISFIERSAEPLLRQIAEQSGGKYRHVDP